MPPPGLKRVSTRHKKTQISSFSVWGEGGSGDGDVKVTQERTTHADAANVTAKKEAKKIVKCRRKQSRQKKIVGKTMHCHD